VALAKYECGTVAELRPARKCNLLSGRLCGASAWRDWASCRSAPALPQLCGFQSACRLPGFIALAADLYEIGRREKSTSVSQSRRDGAVPSLNVKTARSWRGMLPRTSHGRGV
jgi:hypothetical protein